MSAPTSVAHECFEALTEIIENQAIAVWAAAGVDVFAAANALFGLFDVFSPLGEVAQSGAVLAGLAGAVPVHRLRRG
ncbi:hypothetical protein DE4585_02635 [Mycobacteroides salmoniphilum]|uniref:Uncharacterized protein n=1 Tax=Mycobacteroides salmoniphilum TaxID=404941 RepID=A0A4R8S7K0_9MYCO|nr:hypothetical protein [Mycobacteroides salmoniphilum]TDZ82106.1 hypothetical protein DE4585_02635 [Mycobacteroides salmoniphilum]